jgi:hypothetical protein
MAPANRLRGPIGHFQFGQERFASGQRIVRSTRSTSSGWRRCYSLCARVARAALRVGSRCRAQPDVFFASRSVLPGFSLRMHLAFENAERLQVRRCQQSARPREGSHHLKEACPGWPGRS